ncbi:MAG TPA: hypothetical protein VFQ25_00880 [Ktedonobacterales bacterium]|nr:hypothetical protein [Ktedonobacterales bacterium]
MTEAQGPGPQPDFAELATPHEVAEAPAALAVGAVPAASGPASASASVISAISRMANRLEASRQVACRDIILPPPSIYP